MGFNKRVISENTLRSCYKTEGINSVIKSILKPDALVINDKFSEEVVTLVRKKEYQKASELFNG